MKASRPSIWIGCLAMVAVLASADRTALGAPFDHSAWDRLLKDTVQDGVVDYGALENRYPELLVYLKQLEAADVSEMTREEKLAFYINAYNAQCINGVLSNGRIESVRDVILFFKRTRFVLGGQEQSLDSLEHEILRKMGEPRIHFAIVCSAKSCPPLASQAYTGEALEADLERQTRLFLNDPAKNRLDQGNGVFYLSKILKWFKEDFVTPDTPSVLAFIQPYLSEENALYLHEHSQDMKVEYLDYDWSLNGRY